LLFDFTAEPFFPLVGALGLLGILMSLADRRYILPTWLCLIFILDPRKAWTFSMIPLAILAAEGFFRVVLPQVERALAHWEKQGRGGLVTFRGRVLTWTLTIVTLHVLISAFTAGIKEPTPLIALAQDERGAMAWVAKNTAPGSRFLVISGGASIAWTDARSEWFPALTNRVNEATVQGTEWSGGRGALAANLNRYADLQACADGTVACLSEWASAYALSYTHVYLPKQNDLPRVNTSGTTPVSGDRDCCAALRNSLALSPAYKLIHDGPAAQVFELRSGDQTALGDR
jgi:hypothetical protein